MQDHYPDLFNSTSQDLAANESFQAFVFKSNESDVAFWEAFLRMHPGKQRDVDEAIELLTLLTFRKNSLPENTKASELRRLLSSIRTEPARHEIHRDLASPEPGGRLRFFAGYRLAAAVVGILVLSAAAFFVSRRLITDTRVILHTAYGEHSSFTLPDGSTVILNGNTKLIYSHDLGTAQTREVWLEGEAFFDVRHKGGAIASRFVVHIPGINVEVLGTKFNVFNRDERANVVLNSGKVKVNIAVPGDTSSVLMAPDEAVEYSRKDHQIIKKQVNAETLTSWRNKLWVFENTPLYRIAQNIEDTYGVEVIFGSDVNPEEELVGTIPSENLDVLLTVLAKSSDLYISKNQDKIFVTNKDSRSSQP